jgi:hypothetical protein
VGGDRDRPVWLVFLPKRAKTEKASLYTNPQIRDALNTFIALIIVMTDSEVRFSINRLGDNALEHAFGFARIRRHDVETMLRLLGAFAGRYMEGLMKHLLDSAAAPSRRCSVGVDCDPLQGVQKSIFPSRPHAIARAILPRSLTTEIDPRLLTEGVAWGQPWRYNPLFALQRVQGTPRPGYVVHSLVQSKHHAPLT